MRVVVPLLHIFVSVSWLQKGSGNK